MWQAFSATLLVERSKFGLNELLGRTLQSGAYGNKSAALPGADTEVEPIGARSPEVKEPRLRCAASRSLELYKCVRRRAERERAQVATQRLSINHPKRESRCCIRQLMLFGQHLSSAA